MNFGKMKDQNSFFLHTCIVAIGILLSRITGLMRDVVFASLLGTGIVAEAFYVAFRLPNTFRRIFAEGALSNVFVPLFSAKIQHNRKIANTFSAKILIILLLSLLVVTLSVEMCMPYVIRVINPGFINDEEKFNLTVKLARITFPYIILISITAFFGSILNSVHSFWQFSIVSVILNLVLLVGLYLTNNWFSNAGECLSYLLIFAGLLQIVFVAYFCIKKHIFPFYQHTLVKTSHKSQYDQDVKIFLKKLFPAIVSSGILQVNIFIDGIFASFFTGAVSYLYYTDRIGQFPLSIIGYSLSVAILPSLSVAFQQKRKNEIAALQRKSFDVAMFFSIPAMLLITILSKKIIMLIYQHGAFDTNDTDIVALMLTIYALSLPFNVLLKIFFSCFYAQKNTKIPMRISMVALVFNIVSNVILIKFIDMYCVIVSTTLSSVLSCFMAIYYLYRDKECYINTECLRSLVRITGLSVCSCVLVPCVFYNFNLIIILSLVAMVHLALCFYFKVLTLSIITDVLHR